MALRYGDELEPGELQGAPPGDKTTTHAPQVTGLLPPEVYAAHAAEVERTNARGGAQRAEAERARAAVDTCAGVLLAGNGYHKIPRLSPGPIADAMEAKAKELRRMAKGQRKAGA